MDRAIEAEKKAIAKIAGWWYNVHKKYKKDNANKKNKTHRKEAST